MIIPTTHTRSTTTATDTQAIEQNQSVTSILLLSVRKRSPELNTTSGGTTSSSDNNHLFRHDTHHTPAFTTVHIVISVIGILGLIAVTLTITYLCKRQRRKASNQQPNGPAEKALCCSTSHHNSNKTTITTSQHNTNSTSSHSHHNLSTHNHSHDDTRFQQFAMDFDHSLSDIQQVNKPAVVHVEDASSSSINSPMVLSPIMQQYQLQMKLLQQQKMQKRQSHSVMNSSSNVSSVVAAATSMSQSTATTTTTMTQDELIPPPPYRP